MDVVLLCPDDYIISITQLNLQVKSITCEESPVLSDTCYRAYLFITCLHQQIVSRSWSQIMRSSWSLMRLRLPCHRSERQQRIRSSFVCSNLLARLVQS